MPSFDIVSETNIQEVDNAVNQAAKEIENRYDFKSTKFTLELDKEKNQIKLTADSEARLDVMVDLLGTRLIRRGLELGALTYGKKEAAGGMMMKMVIDIKQGLETVIAKDIIKAIKDSKLKVETSIQEKQVRVAGKNIDDLQSVIALLKGKQAELKVPLQYINMRK